MGNIGSSELLIILVLALLLLGPRRLPEVGEALGRTIRKFRQASRDLRDELDVKKDLDPTGELRRDLDLGRDLRESAPRETLAREARRREPAPLGTAAEDDAHPES
jgi:Tat protein translocase TatB subunit